MTLHIATTTKVALGAYKTSTDTLQLTVGSSYVQLSVSEAEQLRDYLDKFIESTPEVGSNG